MSLVRRGLRPDNLWRLGAALALAIGLWVYTTNLENPEASASRDSVTVEARKMADDLIMTSELGNVTVRLTAPQSSLDRLQVGNGFKAYVDLSGLGVGTHRVEVKVESNLPISSYSVAPQDVVVNLDKKGQRTLPVEVKVTDVPPFGYEAKQPRTTPAEITVTGPETAVQGVSKAVINVSAQGQQSTFTVNARPQLLDSSGVEITGLTVTPDKVEVAVPVELQVGYKVIPVKVILRGEPAAGYLVSAISVTPSSVTIIGDPAAVSTTDFLETEPIDISDKTADVSMDVKAVVPQGISIYKEESLRVNVSISPMQTRMVVTLVPVLTGLADGVEASASPNKIDVTLSGSLAALSNLDLDQVKAVVNVAGLGVGVHDVAVGVSTPTGITASNPTPSKVTVTIIAKSAPAVPTPTSSSVVLERYSPTGGVGKQS
jgi:YbbR domain-containing protein